LLDEAISKQAQATTGLIGGQGWRRESRAI